MTPQSVALKIKCHFVEMAGKMKSPSMLPTEIANWLGSNPTQVPKVDCIQPTCPSPWCIRKSGDEFNSWWINSSSASIFFDGASKGNPGISGARGLVYSLDKLLKTKFSWGLGFMSNNQDESYALLKSFQIAKELGFKTIQIFDNS